MVTKRLTFIVLGTFLILSGLLTFISGLETISVLAPILALAAGIIILVATPGISMFIAWIIASVYLILRGGTEIFNYSFPGLGMIMGALALASGILLIIRTPGFKQNFGFLLLCLWLMLVGLTGLVSIGALGSVIAVVAIASGVLMILNV